MLDDDADKTKRKSPVHTILLYTKTIIVFLYSIFVIVTQLKIGSFILKKTVRFQSDIALLVFGIVFHMKLYWTVQDLLFLFCGLYLILPNVVLIPMTENWKRSVLWFAVLHFYPTIVTSAFEDKYLI